MSSQISYVVSRDQILGFIANIAQFEECKYFVISSPKLDSKWDRIRANNFWNMYKEFKNCSEEKVEKIAAIFNLKTVGDMYDYYTSRKLYGLQLFMMCPKGKVYKTREGEWRFYFN